MCVTRHKRVPPHLGRPSTSSMSTTWCRYLKVVPGVVSVLYRRFSLIACPVVALVRDCSSTLIVNPVVLLVCDCSSSPSIGLVPPRVLVVLVTSFPILVSACAPNRLPLVHPECRDCFGSLNGCCVRHLTLTQRLNMPRSRWYLCLEFGELILRCANWPGYCLRPDVVDSLTGVTLHRPAKSL